jgi:hypothetical protein
MLARKAFVLFFLGSITGLAGCMGGASLPASQTPQPLSVLFVSAPPTSLAVQASATLVAAATFPAYVPIGSVHNFVTWSLTCGSPGACGTFSANADANGVTYTAPSAIPTGSTVTVTATSIATPAKNASATITIVSPIPISVSFFVPPPASLQINSSTPLLAAIANDVSARPRVQWTVTCNSTSCGSFSSTTTADEVGTTYTAPAAIPSGNTVTVTAISLTDSTKSVSTTIVITPATPNLANGTYVFQLSAQTGSQASFFTGVFTAANGAVAGGEQDRNYFQSDANDDLVPYPLTQKITGGSYATTSDGNIQVSLQLGPSQVETLTGALASAGRGFVAAINGSPGNGTLDMQTSTAAPSGGYVLSLYGGDQYGDAAWIAGILNVDSSGGISGNGSILDAVDGYSGYGGTHTVGVSTVSAPDAYGRVLFQVRPGSGSTLPSIYLAGYIVDATHIRLIETNDAFDNTNFQGVMGGTALGQGANTGKFTAASVTGFTYVFAAQGTDGRGPLQLAGLLTAGTSGTITGTLNWNDLTNTVQSPLPFTGTYTVDPTGRVTVSKIVGSTFGYSFHLYLTGDGNGLLLSNDTADIFNGQAFQQQAFPFTAASFSGMYGLNDSTYVIVRGSGALQPAVANGSILATAGNSTNAIAGFADLGNGSANFALSGSATPSATGILEGTVAGFNPASRTTAGSFTLYLVDGTQSVLIQTDSGQLNLGHLQLQ